jgi:hypothetical protein
MIKDDKFYFAIRKSDGMEWVDINAWGYVPITCQSKADDTDNALPMWAKDNKVVRIAQFEIKEIDYDKPPF